MGCVWLNYLIVKDEELIKAYHTQKDTQAFNELFHRYSPFLKKKCRLAANNTGLDFNTLHSKYVEMFWKSVEKYNPTKGASFKTFLRKKLQTATYDVLRAEKYRKKADDEGKRLPKEEPIEQENLIRIPDYTDLEGNVVVQEIFDYLASKGPAYPYFLRMMLAGYTYEEIGEAFGRHGSPGAVRNWAARIKAKIAQYVKEYYEGASSVQRRPFPRKEFEVDRNQVKRFSASARLYKRHHEDPTL